MGLLTFAPLAETDLEEIGNYIAADSPAAARRFLAELQGRCAHITEAPRGGRARPELYPGLRSVPFHRHVIFYTAEGQDVRIERILHGARDIEQVFEQDDS